MYTITTGLSNTTSTVDGLYYNEIVIDGVTYQVPMNFYSPGTITTTDMIYTGIVNRSPQSITITIDPYDLMGENENGIPYSLINKINEELNA